MPTFLRLLCSCGYKSNEVQAGYCPPSESPLHKPTWYIPLLAYDDQRLDCIPVCVPGSYAGNPGAMDEFENWLIDHAREVVERVIRPSPIPVAKAIRRQPGAHCCPSCWGQAALIYRNVP